MTNANIAGCAEPPVEPLQGPPARPAARRPPSFAAQPLPPVTHRPPARRRAPPASARANRVSAPAAAQPPAAADPTPLCGHSILRVARAAPACLEPRAPGVRSGSLP
ncbi:hypothetical protein GCM10020218_049500 [Dactylosporangium vinaceum]